MARPTVKTGSGVHLHQRGTVLLATAIVIIAVAGMSAVMMMRSQNNVIKYRHDRREVQADYVADSAVSLGIAELNQEWLPNNEDVGSMSDPSDRFMVRSGGDSHHAPIEVAGASLSGHPKHDGIDNDGDGSLVDSPSDNELVDPTRDDVDSDGYYRGGIYRVQVREWVQKSSGKGEIGAEKIDDDGDDKVDEPGEVKGFTDKNARKFTMTIEASYGNYTIEKRVQTNAIQIEADRFGMYSEDDLTTFPNGLIDSYDSSQGAYKKSRAGNEGNIGAEGDLTVKPNTDVYGNAEYGGNVEVKGTVHGEVKPLTSGMNNTTWSLRRTFESTSGTTSVSAGQVEYINSDLEKLTVQQGGTAIIENNKPITLGSNYTTSPSVAVSSGSGGGGGGGGGGGKGKGKGKGKKGGGGGGGGGTPATIEIQSQAKVFVQGSWEDGADTTIVINGPTSTTKAPTQIYISDKFESNNRTDLIITGRVEMKVVDAVSLGPKSTVNVTTDKPPHFSLQVGGTWWNDMNTIPQASSPGSEVTIKPNSSWEGIISAPEAQGKKAVSLFPNGEFFGALYARNIDMKPNFSFHYDESISSSCYLAIVNCPWLVDNRNAWIVAQRGQGPVVD